MSILNFRRYTRVPVDIAIRFFPKGTDQPVGAFLNDLSEDGTSLVCPFSIPDETLLEFDMKLTSTAQPVHVRAEVLWSKPNKENGHAMFQHGLKFKRLNNEDRQRLHQFIHHAAA
jgi:hypothetical protein